MLLPRHDALTRKSRPYDHARSLVDTAASHSGRSIDHLHTANLVAGLTTDREKRHNLDRYWLADRYCLHAVKPVRFALRRNRQYRSGSCGTPWRRSQLCAD